MKRRNFMWKLAGFFTVKVILPIYLVLDAILMILFLIDDLHSFLRNALITNAVFIIMTSLAFFALAVTGLVLFKKQNFAQDEKYFYRNKTALEKSNLAKLCIGCLGNLFVAEFVPVKNGKFKSCRLMYYFYDYTELNEFLTRNYLIDLLGTQEKNWLSANKTLKGLKFQSDGSPTIERFPCPCCGYLTFTEKTGGTFSICPVCFWEDDELSADEPDTAFDINKISLNDARKNFKMYKACQKEYVPHVRDAYTYERADIFDDL